MVWSLKTPEEIVPFRTLAQILAAKPGGVHSVRATDTAYAALVAMSEKHVGFLVVLESEKLAGVISERDYTRKLIPSGRTAQEARVGDLMTREVVTVTLAHHVQTAWPHGPSWHSPSSRRRRQPNRGRHLGARSAAQAVVHYDKIEEMERERMTIFNSAA
jgi:hypothetical protein